MKRRTIKKNINRFIMPLIKDLPLIHQRVNVIEKGEMRIVCKNNYTIINGNIVPEAHRIPRPILTSINQIKDMAKLIEEIINTHEYVFIRIKPTYEYGRVRMRLITN